MEKVEIYADPFGTLYAVYSNGEKRLILVDVPGTSHYGTLLVEKEDGDE